MKPQRALDLILIQELCKTVEKKIEDLDLKGLERASDGKAAILKFCPPRIYYLQCSSRPKCTGFGELKQRRRRHQLERQKRNRFISAKQQLCTCILLFVHFLAVVIRLQRESA